MSEEIAPPAGPAPPRKLRLFLGLWPTDGLRAAMNECADAWQWSPSARRTAAEKLHITLHFLGDVDASRVPELKQALQVDWPGCEMVLDRAAVWPGGIAVLEATQVPPELVALHSALGDRLRSLAFPVEERRYRPHVTLARKANGARPPAGYVPLRWHAGPGYRLMQSVPGAGYEPLQSFG